MTIEQLELLITHGEDSKVERKQSLDFSSKFVRAEIVRDLLAIVNAHDVAPGYILIGVEDGNGALHDALHLKLDDGALHSFIDEYADPPIPFAFQYVEYKGIWLGVITVAYSEERFHVVKKDFSDGTRSLLTRGDLWIRRGARRDRVTAYDFKRLKDEWSRQNARPEADISVAFGDGTTELRNTATWSAPVSKPDVFTRLPIPISIYGREPSLPPEGTLTLTFEVSSTGNKVAEDVVVFIDIPAGCKIWERSDIPFVLPYVKGAWRTFTSEEDNQIRISGEKLIHGLKHESLPVHIVFPDATRTFELTWTAMVGNMTKPRSGSLKVIPCEPKGD